MKSITETKFIDLLYLVYCNFHANSNWAFGNVLAVGIFMELSGIVSSWYFIRQDEYPCFDQGHQSINHDDFLNPYLITFFTNGRMSDSDLQEYSSETRILLTQFSEDVLSWILWDNWSAKTIGLSM